MIRSMLALAVLAGCGGGARAVEDGPAEAPASPCSEPAARAFDFWLGDWRVENFQKKPGAGPEAEMHPTGTAHSHVELRAGGCVVYERWHGRAGQGEIVGISARAWEADEGRWLMIGHWPNGPARAPFRLAGQVREGEAVFTRDFERPGGGRGTMRFRFSDITEDGLTWTQAFRRAPGSWNVTWRMEFSRLETAPPREAEPAGQRCPEPAARVLDDLVGAWRSADSDAELRVETANEGCTIVDTMSRGGWHRMAIRAYDPAEERWVAEVFDTGERRFRRFEGAAAAAAEPGGFVLSTASDEGALRERWQPTDRGWSWRLERQESGAWSTVRAETFTPRPGRAARSSPSRRRGPG